MSVFELQTGDTIAAFDQNFHPETTGDLDTSDASGTGPNRLTIWVPTEQVTLNMGAAIWGSSGTTEKTPPKGTPPEADAGFVAQTDTHVHFHTFGATQQIMAPNIAVDPDTGAFHVLKGWLSGTGAWLDDSPVPVSLAPARAMLRLGTPGKVVSAGATYGVKKTNTIQTPTSIGSAWPVPFQSWDGYGMITEGGSYQESWGNNVMVAGYGDLRLGGSRMVLLGSPGDVEIVADGDVVADLVSNNADQSNFIDTGKWVQQKLGWLVWETVNAVQTAAWGFVTAAETLFHISYHRDPTPGQTGWDPGSIPKLLAGFASPLIGAYGVYKSLSTAFGRDPNQDHGNVSLYASASFKAYGKTTATLHSELSTTVTAMAATSVGSSIATSVSSDLLMAISGTMTTVGGMMSVGVTSQLGTVTVNGLASSTLSSYGKVFVTGHGPVQVNSVNDSAYLHGQAGFYVGCGAGTGTPVPKGGLQFGVLYMSGPGYGIKGDPMQGLLIGRMKAAYVFGSPQPDDTEQISIGTSGITIKHLQTDITIASNEVTIGKNGTRIHLG